MRFRLIKVLAVTSALSTVCGPVFAKASAEDAARLGKDLTVIGAERAGNADGTVPAYIGKAAFKQEMLTQSRQDLEDLRVRLVEDIQGMIGNADALGDILQQAQTIMDAEPGKADQVISIIEEMLSSDKSLKKEFDSVLSSRGGKSVDSLISQVKARQIKLPEMKDDISAVISSFQSRGDDWMSRLVSSFDIGRVLEIINLVDDPKTRIIVNDMMMKYMPPYVQGFLDYKTAENSGDALTTVKPLYVINKANLAEHKDKLSEGHLALFATYPDYKMIVYPSVRNAFFPDEINKATVANATRASLNGTDDVRDAVLGFPFPIPNNGAEVLWNHKLKFRGSAAKRYNNQAIVKPNGEYQISKLVEDVKFKYASITEPASPEKNSLIAYYLQEVMSPVRVAGQIILVHENAGGEGNTRNAWIYSPALGRVNRAPDVGFDNPSIGSDGEQFNDQIDMFNGSLERYDYKLVGKKEVLIPYNSWVMNSPTFKYKDIIRPNHINQDLARYEKHRVWVVEATVRDGQRHRFGKRRFYLDEDSWSIAIVDCYDNRGELWKVQEAHLITAPFIPTVSGVPEVIYDLQSKRYFATALSNEDAIVDFEITYKDREFQPSALKRKTRR